MEIPNIIHQVYEGRDGSKPPKELMKLSESWQQLNPNWEYRLWNYETIDTFLLEFYLHFIPVYKNFTYNVQRWDAIRYLILLHYGGLYVDLDYQCIEPIDDILINKTCCFGVEPPEHAAMWSLDLMVGNAFIASVPGHPFISLLIDELSKPDFNGFEHEVMNTTGPLMITRVYSKYKDKELLLPFELVTPLTKTEIRKVILGDISPEIKTKIEQAYAIHYFWGSWLNEMPGWNPIYFRDYL